MSQALRKLAGAISQSNGAVMFIDQLREKIGVMFGNPETTTGGKALKFYASVRLDIRRIGPVKEGERSSAINPGQSGQEQGGAAVPPGGVRHDVRRGHQSYLPPGGSRLGGGHHPEVGRLVFLWRSAHRARPGKRQALPPRQPPADGRSRGEGEGAARCSRRGRLAARTTSDDAEDRRARADPRRSERCGSKSTASASARSLTGRSARESRVRPRRRFAELRERLTTAVDEEAAYRTALRSLERRAFARSTSAAASGEGTPDPRSGVGPPARCVAPATR